MERLLRFVPGLGIRACEPTGLVTTGPVTVSPDRATLTVKNLLSTGGGNDRAGGDHGPTLGAECLAAAGAARPARRAGHNVSAGSAGAGMSAGGAVATGGPQTFRAEAVFVGLNPDVRVAELEVTGPDPFGVWQVRVPSRPSRKRACPRHTRDKPLPPAESGGAGSVGDPPWRRMAGCGREQLGGGSNGHDAADA